MNITAVQEKELIQTFQDLDRSSAEERSADKHQDSHHSYISLFCTNCGYMYVAQLNCGDRTCPLCRRKWYGYHFRTLSDVMSSWKEVRIMELTLKNISDNDFSKESVKYLRRSFSRLIHRKYFKNRIKGGFYFIHITNIGQGFHLHMHVVYEGEYIDQRKLSQAWREITKDSYIVYIRRKKMSVRRALIYLLGDLLQKVKIFDQYTGKYNEVMKGSRLVQAFGCYAHEKLRQPFLCPVCNNDNWYCPHYDHELNHGRIWSDTS